MPESTASTKTSGWYEFLKEVGSCTQISQQTSLLFLHKIVKGILVNWNNLSTHHKNLKVLLRQPTVPQQALDVLLTILRNELAKK